MVGKNLMWVLYRHIQYAQFRERPNVDNNNRQRGLDREDFSDGIASVRFARGTGGNEIYSTHLHTKFCKHTADFCASCTGKMDYTLIIGLLIAKTRWM